MIAEVLGPVVRRIHPQMAEEVVGQMLALDNLELLRLLRSAPELLARTDEVAHDLSWTSTVGAEGRLGRENEACIWLTASGD